MKSLKHRSFWIIGLALLIAACCPLFAFAAEEAAEPVLYGTFWSLIPPIIAIALALITKEVYSSLFYRYRDRWYTLLLRFDRLQYV